jgi:acyl-CoA reductase-like NAD-dependent aldehyde dehydrogenase
MATSTIPEPGARAAPRDAARLLESLPSRLSGSAIQRLAEHATVAPGERERLDVITPLSLQAIGMVPRCTEADVEEAVRRARAAQASWAATPVKQRAAIFLRFHDLVLARQDEVLDLIQLESGKSRRHAVEEALDVANVTRYYGVRAKRLLRPRRRKGALPLLTSTVELRHPIGVIGFISPWNFPLILAITDAIPALIAGNAAVLKPDHQSSFTALWALALLREAGLPRDVCQIVSGRGAELGPHILRRVDFAMFTGSNETGRTIAGQAAERLIGYSLELGGKNPMIVLEDADIDAAVETAVQTCFVGAGQVCVSIERVFVARPLFERFTERMVARTKQLRLGASFDYSMDVGSLTTPRQLATVDDHVRDARQHGATVLIGGRARPDLGPLFYEPTLLTGVREGMKAYAEETFGPVVALYPFDSMDDAIERANDTRFGRMRPCGRAIAGEASRSRAGCARAARA